MALDYSSILWSDVNTNYGEDGDPELVVDVAAINNSLYNIFTCQIGSRPNEREYGSQLLAQLFQPADNITADDIMFGLIQSIERWEPRVFVRRDLTWVRPLGDGGDGFDIKIEYIIKRTQRTARYQFTARRSS